MYISNNLLAMSQKNLFCCTRRNLYQRCSSLVSYFDLLQSFNYSLISYIKTLKIRDQFFLYMNPVAKRNRQRR
jgi:hypothetical protein